MPSEKEKNRHFDGVVIGGGPTGWLAAMALSLVGERICLVARDEVISDNRTVALMQGSLKFLDKLGLAPETIDDSTPLETMRLIDGTRRLIRAPEVSFHASEAGFSHFALNIPIIHLITRIKDRLASDRSFSWKKKMMDCVQIRTDDVVVRLVGGSDITARYVVGADGKNSQVRKTAGIELKEWHYDQTALVTTFSHSKPHRNISTEFHTETGPFTIVPLQANRCSVVCVVTPDQAKMLMELTEEDLITELERRCHGIVGNIGRLSSQMIFPMSAHLATKMALGRAFLVGESGHSFPPIGAQGLNLSIRDISSLADIIGTANGDSVVQLSGKYALARRADAVTRTMGVDLLNRSLLTDFLPVQMVRGLGLYAAKSIPPIRKALMRSGLGAYAN